MYRESIYISENTKNMWVLLQERYRTEKTKQFYWNNIISLCEFTKKDFCEVSISDMRAYYESEKIKERKMNQRPGTTKVRIAALNALYEWYGENVDQSKENPCMTCREVFNADPFIPAEYPSLQELNQIMDQIKNDLQMHAICALMEDAGAKPGELLKLTQNSFQKSEENGIKLAIGCRDRARVVHFDSSSIIVKFLSVTEGKKYLFESPRGKKLTQRTLERNFNAVSKQSEYNMNEVKTALIARHMAICPDPQKYAKEIAINRVWAWKYIELSEFYRD